MEGVAGLGLTPLWWMRVESRLRSIEQKLDTLMNDHGLHKQAVEISIKAHERLCDEIEEERDVLAEDMHAEADNLATMVKCSKAVRQNAS